jgi:hypothetical protein
MGTIQFQKVGIGYKIAVCSKKLHQLGVSQIAERLHTYSGIIPLYQ